MLVQEVFDLARVLPMATELSVQSRLLPLSIRVVIGTPSKSIQNIERRMEGGRAVQLPPGHYTTVHCYCCDCNSQFPGPHV